MEDSNSEYERLRSAFEIKISADTQYMRENEDIARKISDGFREFVGMPRTYDTFGENRTQEPYIKYYEIETDDDEREFIEQNHLLKAIAHYNDGHFEYGMGVTLESRPNSFPKRVIQIAIACRREGDKIQIDLGGHQTSLTMKDGEFEGLEEVHADILMLLNQYLERRMGDKQKGRIGFI